uniref:Amidase domain-containing protein n=1 Tax=Steinernema glaseri TaxID=37863 RepID=A0A1I7Y281_9BILA
MWWESVNSVYGRSRNPYDTRRITGGSSGGEGALISAAGSVIGIGSDIGGSIRMPAYFNGVFGLKPSPGVVPLDGHLPEPIGYRERMLRIGPMCRYAKDLKTMLQSPSATASACSESAPCVATPRTSKLCFRSLAARRQRLSSN